MNTDRDRTPLNDEALEAVNGGFNMFDSLTHIGQSVERGFLKGRDVGSSVGGVAGARTGAAVGAMIGVVGGLKDEIGRGVNEAAGGIKQLLR